ncbi:MAG: AZOBR_p60025 family cell surface glycopolymer formation protein [Solirubrobacteraceae bacterium]
MSAITGAAPRGPGAGGDAPRALAWISRTDAYGPALIVGLLLSLLTYAGVLAYHGNPTGFVRFGTDFAAAIRPPHGAVVAKGTGYDGQYFWSLAQDPLILHTRTLIAFATQTFRLQRIAYPALAWLLAGGRGVLIPWTLIALNLLVIVGATLAFSQWARRRGMSGWWGLAFGLLPGFVYAVLADLSDALAVTSMVAGLVAYREGRRWRAAVLLALAGLAREPMMLAVAAVGIDGLERSWRTTGVVAKASATLRAWWPAAIVPGLAFIGWQAYVDYRIGRPMSDPGTAFAAPFIGVANEVHHALGYTPLRGAWDLCYLALMLVGIVVAAALVRRRRCPVSIAALLFGLVLPVLVFGDPISYARLSAPMFACLLLVGLERRSRPVLAIAVAVATLGALVPFGVV